MESGQSFHSRPVSGQLAATDRKPDPITGEENTTQEWTPAPRTENRSPDTDREWPGIARKIWGHPFP
jgi:hypothetical protein